MHGKKIFLAISLLVLIKFSYAAPMNSSAKNLELLECDSNSNQVYVDNMNYVLNKITPKKNPEIYFIHNISKNHFVMIDHKTINAGAKAGWASQIAPGNWSAIAATQTDFALSCSIVQDGKLYEGGCAKLISVCQHPTIKIANGSGNYWLSENKSFAETFEMATSKSL